MSRAVTALLFLLIAASGAEAQDSNRQRVLFTSDWRFCKGDPDTGQETVLRYDVRPSTRATTEPPDAKPQKTEKLEETLKPWILPTGNSFIADRSRWHQRPEGNPGADLSYVRADFDDNDWKPVTLPHDWAIEGPYLTTGPSGGMGRLPSWGVGWYRKKFLPPAEDADKRILLEIDGAMSYAGVWMNGQFVGGWPYGYSSWCLDLTPYIHFGRENQLAIRLDNPPDSSRWYPGGGIYRNVWLIKTAAVHVAQWGTHISTADVSAASAKVELEAAINNESSAVASLDVLTQIFALYENGVRSNEVVAQIDPIRSSVGAGAIVKSKGSVIIDHPRLWGPPPDQKPNRYIAVTTLLQEGKAIDRYETPFGIRSLRFDPESGVWVNGQHVPLQGVNMHHDLGALGAAFNYRAAQRQLEILREMGCNAIRMSHNPPAPELLDLTDQMGFLVIDEIFDVWFSKKTPLDFHLIFPDWHEQDLRAMIRRDRNHPSVFLWSIGNEVGEQYSGAEGARIAESLSKIAHEEDDSRPTTTAMNWAKADMPLPAAVDVISLNYQGAGIRSLPGQFPAFRAKFPRKVILSSETASALSSRGEYLFPVSGSISAPVRPGSGGDPKTRQVSAYEIYAADFGSSPDKVFASQDQNPFVAGEFVWSGFDYLGEPTPYYSSRSSYSGIIDLAGFKKDRFYLYQSRWRPDLRFAHILPHWTWPDRVGEVTPVHVFSSADEAELFVNGKSQGRKKKGPYEYRFRWDFVTYEPGELKVETYKHGEPWASSTVKTSDVPAKLQATADRGEIRTDGVDLCFVTVRVTDKDGNTVPRAGNEITFSVDGPGEIVATDNGDPTSFEPFQSLQRHAFNGLCLAIVRATRQQTGIIALHARADGLREATVEIRTIPGSRNP